MTGPEQLRDAWSLVEELGPDPSGFRVRHVSQGDTPGTAPLIGIDPSGLHLLLFPVAGEMRLSEDRISSGVQIVDQTLAYGREERRFVAVRCRKSHLNELFSIIAAEMLEEVSRQSDRPDLACRRVLGRWREFLEREPRRGPGEAELVAVLGELICLRDVLRYNPGAIACWTGPLGERHDFSSIGISLEVKTTRSREGRRVTIHGIEQLEEPAGGMLYLAVLRLERVADGGETLPELVAGIQALGCDNLELMQRLSRVGVDAGMLHELGTERIVLKERDLYVVNDQFPRIISSSLVGGGVPPGIVAVDYSVDLTGEIPAPLTESRVSEVFQLLAFGGRSASAGPTVGEV